MPTKELKDIQTILRKLDSYESDPEIVRRLIKDIKKELSRIDKHLKEQENKLEGKLLKNIKQNKKDPFTREDIWELFPNYPKDELIKILKKLIRNKKIKNIGRNLYSLRVLGTDPIIKLSKEMEELRILLNDNGITFLITGPDIVQEYINLIPKRMIHLIYVARGSGEWVRDLIEKKTRRMCIINPSRKEVRNLFSHYADDIIIIREVGESAIEYHKEGIATIEKAIVDLYFETTRKRIPFGLPELANILQNILKRTRINHKRLLRSASRRNMQLEFIKILNALNIHIPGNKVEESFRESKVDKIIRLFK